MPGVPTILRTAHGRAAELGAVLVAETPPLDEHPTPNPDRTAQGLAERRVRGRPYQKGNNAAAGRGPSLTRVPLDAAAQEADAKERERTMRKATRLHQRREREMSVQYAGLMSSAVKVELKAWALATAWSDYHYRAGDAVKGANLAEKSSAHGLKAIGIAERELLARSSMKTQGPTNAHAALAAAISGEKEPTS